MRLLFLLALVVLHGSASGCGSTTKASSRDSARSDGKGSVPAEVDENPVSLSTPRIVAGSGFTMRLPTGSERLRRTAGYFHAGAGITVLVTEMPVPFADVERDLVRETSVGDADNKPVAVRSTHDGSHHKGRLVFNVHRISGRQVSRWVLLTGNEERAAVLSLMATGQADVAAQDAVTSMLESVSWAPVGSKDAQAVLGVTVDGFEGVERIAAANNVIAYTLSNDGSSIFHLTYVNFGQSSRTDAETCRALLRVPGRDLKLDKHEIVDVRKADLPGCELAGEASAPDGTKKHVYRLVLLESQGAIVVSALGAQSSHVGDFRTLADGIQVFPPATETVGP